MTNLTRRIEQLEGAASAHDAPAEPWVQISVGRGDTEEAAKARYIAEHPEMPPPTHWIVLVPVSPGDPECRKLAERGPLP